MDHIMHTPAAKTGGLNPAYIVIPLLALGTILTAAGIHGYSFSAWHAAIDGSPQSEVFLNEAKGYRSDDWVVALPHALAQRAVSPAFPADNPLVGDGHYNMIISGPAPVRDLTVLFRPQVWGYFISGDVGMAFQWWFGALGLWIAVWLVLLRLTANDRWTSAFGATALLFSPFFQAWSLNCAPSVVFACGLLLALLRLRTTGALVHLPLPSDLTNGCDGARPATPALLFPWRDALRRGHLDYQQHFQVLMSTVMLAWFGMAFLLTFNYTPYLVSLLYLVVFMFAGFVFTYPARLDNPRLRRIGAGLAGLVILGLGAYVVISNWETILVIQNSDYPGRRISTGGDQTIWHIFRGNILSLKPPPDWRYLNPCEGAAFFMVFPLVVAVLLRDWWRSRKAPPALFFWIGGYILFLLVWNLSGLPELLSRWTLLNRAPPNRTLLGLGIADLFLLAGYVSARRQAAPALRTENISPWIISALWIAFHLALAIRLSNYFPGYSLGTALIGGLFAMALAPLLYLAPRLVLPAIMAVSIFATYDINPLARGGTAFVHDNPLSRKIMELDRESFRQGHQPVWIAYGDMVLPNLFRMLGARAINGVHAYPQLELWKKLDPEGQYRSVYNRYAHVVFDLPSAEDDIVFHLQQPDLFIAFLSPAHPRFADLGVDYILCLDHQTATFDRLPNLQKCFSFAGKHIYRVGGSQQLAE